MTWVTIYDHQDDTFTAQRDGDVQELFISSAAAAPAQGPRPHVWLDRSDYVGAVPTIDRAALPADVRDLIDAALAATPLVPGDAS